MIDRKSSTNVERSAEILLRLSDGPSEGMSPSELANEMDDTKSAVHRALVGLSNFGFVVQANRRGKYRIGPALYGIAMKPRSIRETVQGLRPVLMTLSESTGASTYLLSRAGRDSICLDFEEGTYPIQPMAGGIGGRLPLGVGAASICMLASMDDKTRETIISLNAPKYRGTTTIEKVRKYVQEAQENGYIVRKGDLNPNIVNIAMALPEKSINRNMAISAIILNDDVGNVQNFVEKMMGIVQEHAGGE